jgi:predicted transcriptional regulator
MMLLPDIFSYRVLKRGTAMNRVKDEKQSKKDVLRKLREARKETIGRSTLRMKEQRKVIDAVKKQLAAGAKTVPELAEAVGISTSEAMWYVASLKKYGVVAEGEKDGSYFRYELADSDAIESNPDPLEKG